jgi:hypothetical protein
VFVHRSTPQAGGQQAGAFGIGFSVCGHTLAHSQHAGSQFCDFQSSTCNNSNLLLWRRLRRPCTKLYLDSAGGTSLGYAHACSDADRVAPNTDIGAMLAGPVHPNTLTPNRRVSNRTAAALSHSRSMSASACYQESTIIYWFLRIRSVADSLINSDFADFNASIGMYSCAFGVPCSSLRVTHKLQGPKQRDRRTRFPKIRFQVRRFTSRAAQRWA